MAKPYKSVLEAYNESLKHRLPTAEEQAIEPVYPEEYLIGGPGKAVASGFRSGAEKAAAKAAQRERIANVKIGSKARDIEADKATAEAFSKTKWGQATNEALKKQAEQATQIKNQQEALRQATMSANRAAANFSGEAGANIGSELSEQRRNAAGDTYKTGGMTASRRGDGIAARGKTKGRFV